MWKFLVKQQKIEILEREVIASDQISFVTLKFIFDGIWKELHKVIQFTQCDETYNRVLGTDGLSCKLPSELHPGTVKMSIFGYSTKNTDALRATTVPITLNIKPSGFVGDGITSIPPTPDLYQQLLQKLNEKADSMQIGADGKDGKDGFSPVFTVTKTDDGYTLELTDANHTETISLRNGEEGAAGVNGENGKSAYELAVDDGYTGTLAEWIESLQGEKGDKGEKGDTGLQGNVIKLRKTKIVTGIKRTL